MVWHGRTTEGVRSLSFRMAAIYGHPLTAANYLLHPQPVGSNNNNNIVWTHRQKMASLPSRYNPLGPHRPGSSTTAAPRTPDRQTRLPSLDGSIRVTVKDKVWWAMAAPDCCLLLPVADRISFCKEICPSHLLERELWKCPWRLHYKRDLSLYLVKREFSQSCPSFDTDNHILSPIRRSKNWAFHFP